ncbi:hypothetical protein B0T10DRAFT_145389 [Thelonectria olida]|uniref:Uncharacterized protein n=1 Tax=Thelonectria olida TaxID=1576542 RepID=A0A9P8VW17_9HYPO|nr:hypothetical protein B0T10DRAFT_145389 [Thelonectria olida]
MTRYLGVVAPIRSGTCIRLTTLLGLLSSSDARRRFELNSGGTLLDFRHPAPRRRGANLRHWPRRPLLADLTPSAGRALGSN